MSVLNMALVFLIVAAAPIRGSAQRGPNVDPKVIRLFF